jgi:LPS sulfotransferase NodH
MDFIILADARTGSNLLSCFLNLQKNILCHAEIFNLGNNRKATIPEEEIEIDPIHLCWKLRHKPVKWKHPQDLLEKLIKDKENKTMGFKLLYNQAISLNNIFKFDLINYIKENNTKIIIIERKNKFLKNLSLQKAIMTKCFATQNPNDIKLTKIRFNLDNYKYHLQYAEGINKKYKEYFNQNNIQYIETSYEDITGTNKENNLKNILEFIGENTENTRSINEVKMLKQNLFTLEEEIINIEDLKIFLKDDIDFQEAYRTQGILPNHG